MNVEYINYLMEMSNVKVYLNSYWRTKLFWCLFHQITWKMDGKELWGNIFQQCPSWIMWCQQWILVKKIKSSLRKGIVKEEKEQISPEEVECVRKKFQITLDFDWYKIWERAGGLTSFQASIILPYNKEHSWNPSYFEGLIVLCFI